MAKVNMNIRTDSEIKAQAERIFTELGMNMTTAINLFLRQAVRQNGIPFELKLDTPNAETIAAMHEINDEKTLSRRFSSVKELMEDLNA